ncbi:hypothetical protein H8M03_08990 [Sphingomonas sabuli]|uniref:Uncharacterized protein n=1 Tax=Sphingomonas sabuli TaxID=2764186 RepID=A0A7G9L0L0_9SPHN|nr:hypothetical protein [Sphingomonas sabuli]QNM82159.1 hypothetical protein H8M03_08990 [Sphingomonas sabuli]
MKRLILAAGVAALAITVPASAKPGEKGGHQGHNAGQAQKGGGNKANARQAQKRAQARQEVRREARQDNRREARQDNRREIKQRAAARENRQDLRQAQRANERRLDQRREALVERRADARNRLVANRMEARDRLAERRRDIADSRDNRAYQLRRLANERRMALAERNWNARNRQAVWSSDCPPGLAKKQVACMPPGIAKRLVGEPISLVRREVAFRDIPTRLRTVYRDTPDYYYKYGNGYVYRVNRSNDLVSSLLPLFGLGLATGQVFPQGYNNYAMPSAYQPFYPASAQTNYRYANGYMYEIDPYSRTIQNVNPMLGYGYGYGQMLPANYSVYNVPYQYRGLYADSGDNYYRYAPGSIYQVDPQTSLITGIAALLGNGMTIGQPLPAGYGVYNVPYDYRMQYVDTSNDWYRYSAGNIYRVDPTTQLVTALVASILT